MGTSKDLAAACRPPHNLPFPSPYERINCLIGKERTTVKESIFAKKHEQDSKVATAVAIAVTSSVAFAALSIAVLTAVYCKSLLDVEYIGDSDVYDE